MQGERSEGLAALRETDALPGSGANEGGIAMAKKGTSGQGGKFVSKAQFAAKQSTVVRRQPRHQGR
jgi:hypothetical protein